jgi:hypothetical protein
LSTRVLFAEYETVADYLVIEHARMEVHVEIDWHRPVLGRMGKLTADSGQQAGA